MKRLIILLLIVGCEEFAPTDHTHTDTGGTAIDTLYIYNNDTLIITNYDTTLVNNYDTLIVTNYDTVYIDIEGEGMEIDWVLIKTPNFIQNNWNFDPSTIVIDIGYRLYYNYLNITDITDIVTEGYQATINDGILSFTFNTESFSYDISDSYNEEIGKYFYTPDDHFGRIVCYDNLSYCYFISENTGISSMLNFSFPIEVIDYR